MLACTRLGAPHTVVFGGFSADSLSDRANDMGCEVLVTQDEAWRRGTTVPLKRTADEAMADAPGIEGASSSAAPATRCRCRRAATTGCTTSTSPTTRRPARPSRWTPRTCSSSCTRPARPRSRRGSRTRPAATSSASPRRTRYIFDLKPEDDVYWCAADIGWITGHSYIVYGPLCNGTDLGPLRGHARLPGQGPLVGDRRALRRHDPLHGADRDPRAHEVGAPSTRRSTISPRCGCSARSASRSTRRRGSGTASTSAATGRPSSTRGGRPRRG